MLSTSCLIFVVFSQKNVLREDASSPEVDARYADDVVEDMTLGHQFGSVERRVC